MAKIDRLIAEYRRKPNETVLMAREFASAEISRLHGAAYERENAEQLSLQLAAVNAVINERGLNGRHRHEEKAA